MTEQHPDFERELLDLKEIDLPLMDESNHPSAGKYTKEHTKKLVRPLMKQMPSCS